MIDYTMEITIECDECEEELSPSPVEYASRGQLLVGFDYFDYSDWHIDEAECLCPNCNQSQEE